MCCTYFIFSCRAWRLVPHLHDCKVIADLVEQGRSEVEWVYLRGGKGGGGEEEEGMEEWRKEQTKKKRRQ